MTLTEVQHWRMPHPPEDAPITMCIRPGWCGGLGPNGPNYNDDDPPTCKLCRGCAKAYFGEETEADYHKRAHLESAEDGYHIQFAAMAEYRASKWP